MARLQEHYQDVVRGALIERFGYRNPMRVPRLEKIVLNMGVGEATQDAKKLQAAMNDMVLISGQGMAIGCKVTLRGRRMYEFLDRLINVALPRVRDFRGLPAKSFDGRGNYALGLKEQIIFPEINYDAVDEIRGMDVVICTTAPNDEEARALLEQFNMPFAS